MSASDWPDAAADIPEVPAAPAAFPGFGEPLAPTVVLPGTQLDPTAATTVLGGGSGGPPVEPPKGGGFSSWEPRRKALFIALMAVAGVLFIAIVVLLIVLITGSKPGPTPSPSPSPTVSPTVTPSPTKSPTPTPTPVPTAATITSFVADVTSFSCPNTTQVNTVKLTWVAPNAVVAAIAKGTAQVYALTTQPNWNGLAPQGALSVQLPCSEPGTWVYTLTVAGTDNQKKSQTSTITVNAYTPPPPVAAPALTSVSWTDGTDYVLCPSFDDGDVVTKSVSWASTPSVNGVEVWLATSDSAYPGPSGTFVQAASGLPATGHSERLPAAARPGHRLSSGPSARLGVAPHAVPCHPVGEVFGAVDSRIGVLHSAKTAAALTPGDTERSGRDRA